MTSRRCPKTIGWFVLAAALASAASGCATVHPGRMGVVVDDNGRWTGRGSQTPLGLRISARELEELSSESVGLVEVTIENTSREWVKIHEVHLDFGNAVNNEAVHLIEGEDLQAWLQGAQLRAARKRQNDDAALLAVAMGGLFLGIAGGISGSPGLEAVGDLALIGSLSVAAGRDINRAVEQAQSPPPYPDNHLFALPLSVPPAMAVKKFVVLDTAAVPRQSCLAWMYFGYRTGQGHQERVVLRVGYPSGSDWKVGLCTSRAPS
jgi:hypothetical protein